MPEFTTPLMKQYAAIKQQYSDCLVFFRLGDFYELFLEDATTGAQILDITLTSRPEGADGRIPMAGVPFHAVDSYLAKLVKAGYKVAICEQMSPPNKKGIVERDVVRVVTPGTLIDEKALERKENNFIISVILKNDSFGLAAADLSTGDVRTLEIHSDTHFQTLSDELAKIHPSECLLNTADYENHALLKILKAEKNLSMYPFLNWHKYADNAEKFLTEHFKLKTISVFGISDKPLSLQACAALIGYLKETQKDKISHIKKITLNTPDTYVALDKSTMINLELFTTIRERDAKGSLLSILDHTQTAMGGRMLRFWLANPLTQTNTISARYDAVDELLSNSSLHTVLQELLAKIPDIERIFSRLSVGIGNARDLVNVKQSLQTILFVKKELEKSRSPLLHELGKQISADLQKIITTIQETIVDEPPISLREGGLMRKKINATLDTLKQKISGSKEWIMTLEGKEKERTGISTLKVRFNKVFGFYIEVSRAHADKVPPEYMRKQTLVNGERFITKELKEQEEIVLAAEAQINEIEYQMFQDLLQKTLTFTEKIKSASQAIASIDCLNNFSFLARKNRYVRPALISTGEIHIKNGRHPVVENILEDTQFSPNDCLLNHTDSQLLIITGPNMAGKSVYIRQIAIIVLMAQTGCFVPADSAEISLADKIFVRSGASDVITSGLSTFMVEMMETAHILNNVSKNSLIVIDEIGRGTSTYDGISIAWAVAEYLVTHPGNPKTLFATHYHELQALEEEYPDKIKNYHMAVDNSRGDPIFLHTIMKGAASHSFGVVVAKLAGIPESVVEKAFIMLQTLEAQKQKKQMRTEEIFMKELELLDIYKLTPLEALNILASMREKINN